MVSNQSKCATSQRSLAGAEEYVPVVEAALEKAVNHLQQADPSTGP